MKKLTIYTLLSIAVCLPTLSQSSKDKREGLKRIGGGPSDDDISIIINGSVLSALEGLEGLENLGELSELSSLSSLSELSSLGELGRLGNFDFDFNFDFDHDFDFDFDFDDDFDVDIDLDFDDDFDFDFDFDFDNENVIIDLRNLDDDTRDQVNRIVEKAKDAAKRKKRDN